MAGGLKGFISMSLCSFVNLLDDDSYNFLHIMTSFSARLRCEIVAMAAYNVVIKAYIATV